MKNILILLTAIILFGRCTNLLQNDKDIIIYYISPNTEFCKNISFEDIAYMSENLIKRTDTIYVSDSVLKQIREIKYMNMNTATTCRVDCRIFVKIHTTHIFIDSFGNVGGPNGMYENSKELALWRYLIKEESGYYNNLHFKEDLKYDTDIKLFGIPHKYKPNTKQHIGYKKDGVIKVVFKPLPSKYPTQEWQK